MGRDSPRATERDDLRLIYAVDPDDVKAMRSMNEADAWERASHVYLTEYWVLGGCDELPWPQDIVRFDSTIQAYSGWLQDWKDTMPDVYHFLLRRRTHYQIVDMGAMAKQGWLGQSNRRFGALDRKRNVTKGGN